MTVMTRINNSVAVITLDNPPVNSLGALLRTWIVEQLTLAQADPLIQAVVLTGSAKAFSAGADVTEFGTPQQLAEPILPTVIACLESSDKPVVAAIAGVALGGGLELAMACHARVALASARVGLPEVTLGLIPGSGGTQRLSRLVGIDLASDLILSGQPKTAKSLVNSGLFAEVVTDDLIEAASRLARDLVRAGFPFPRARDLQLDAGVVAASIQAQRSKLNLRQRLQPAFGAALDALAASAKGFDEGLRNERESFLKLVSTPAAQALRYQFKAEREATRLPPSLQAVPRPIQRVAVIGAGTMGSGIAVAILDAGFEVVMLEQDSDALERGRVRVVQHYGDRVAAGKLDAVTAAGNESRLTTTMDWHHLAEVDLVIEAVFEDMDVKKSVFQKIDAHSRPGAVLATNTSYLDIDAIAAITSRPADVLGLHFFSPANIMKLLEVVRGAATSPDVLATGMALGTALKKVPVMSGNAFGFIGNRIYNAYRRQCEFMLEDGAWPEDVDGAITAMGFAMGPFAVADLSGLDIAWRMRKAQSSSRDPRERYVPILDHLCERGRLGRKSGAGYYAYEGGKSARTTDATVREVILQASKERGIARQHIAAATIQRRTLLAMVNEAALLFSEGVASRASDIDVVLVQGYGFPRWEGGPVFWARQQDRAQLRDDLQQLAREAGHGQRLGDLSALLDV